MNPDHWTLHMQINNFLNSALKKTLKLHVPLPVLEKLKLLKVKIYLYDISMHSQQIYGK